MVQKQQNVSEPVPPFYIKTLIQLEEAVNEALLKEKEAKEKEPKKKLNATLAKALTAMRQKLKKAVKEHESDIAKFKRASLLFLPLRTDLIVP